ncbi:MAG: pimelyl-ACP methyl ester esterase BioV [Campylobacterales bacterium]|nr:pimelyl-ACP methyl ester esterase BioV [Campylobacterales bacterium]
MKFFSGFSLLGESYLFDAYINNSEYSACGFSYGAIKAFHYVEEQLACGNRIDTLQLFSPAYFQSKSKEFKRLQLMAYKKNQSGYLKEFMNACFIPHAKKKIKHDATTFEELEELLNYSWNIAELQALADKGVKIEVYLGGEDKIIDVQRARWLFLNVATVTYIKNANHFLQTN